MNKLTEKRILVFYPHNFIEMSAGTHRRIHEIAEYFKERNIIADLLSIDGFTNNWDEDSLRTAKLFFRNIYISKWRPDLAMRIKGKWPIFRSNDLSDFAVYSLRSTLKNILSTNEYNIFFNSYVFWGKLADLFPNNVVKIIDIHDFVTLNEYMQRNKPDFTAGAMFQQEIQAINKHDHAVSISEEESLILQPFCSHAQFTTIPVSFSEKFTEKSGHKYDAVFVGSDNPFNVKGLTWFMNTVYPMLPRTMTLAMVGRITRCVEPKPNISLISHPESLDDIYADSRMAICPLMNGTGLKVKVVEALSFGKPLVTTTWGLSGILQKNNNGCILANEPAAFAQAMARLISDQQYFVDAVTQARSFFREHFTRNVCWNNFDSLFLASVMAVKHDQRS